MSNQPGNSSKVLAIVLAVALVAVAVFAFVTNGQKGDLQKKVDDLTTQVTSLQGELDTAKTMAQETADAAAKAAEEAAAKAAEVAAAAEQAAAEAAEVVAGETTEEVAEEATEEATEEVAEEVATEEATEEAAEEVAAEAAEEPAAEEVAVVAAEEPAAEEAATEAAEGTKAASSAPEWKAFDALIQEIKTTTDYVKREALMHQAEDMLMDTGALIPIYYYNDIYLAKPEVEGYYSNPFGTKFFHLATKGDETTLRLQLASEPDKLDPALNSTVDGASLAANSFGGLYTYDEKGELAPNFATGVEVSEDGMTYVFTIRDDLKWSNGDPLTAKDFEYSWKRAVAGETAADYAYMFGSIEGYYNYAENTEGKGKYNLVDGAYVDAEVDAEENPTGQYDLAPAINVVASEDGKTFTVKLSAPTAYFLDLAAFPTFFPVHQASVEAAEGYKDADGNVVSPGAWALEAGFVSSGPFMLTEWTHGESMAYVKNPNYWNAEAVKLERLEFMLSADEVVIYNAYVAGDLDFIDTVPPDQIKTLIDTPEFHKVDELGTYYAIFNVNSPIFDGMTVEQAAALRKGIGRLIDRNYIIESVAQTGQVPATSFIPAGMLDGQGGVFKSNDGDFTYPVEDGYYPVEPSVEDAVALFKEAGLEVGDDNKLVEPMTLTYIFNTNASHQQIGELIQQDLAQVGIEVKLETQEWNVFLNERKQGNFDFARNGWIADFNDPINMLEMWTTDSGNNDAQFGR